MAPIAGTETSGPDGEPGSLLPQVPAVPSQGSPQRSAASSQGGHRRLPHGKALQSPPGRAGLPDLGVLAREAVVGFLRDADGISAAEGPLPSEAAITASRLTAESAAWRAAELSVAALDRIEATVASVEADICAALQAQTDLQAGAGEAVEAAVRAAQVAWVAAGTAVEAHKGAMAALRKVEHYVSLTILLTVIAIIILAVGGIPLH